MHITNSKCLYRLTLKLFSPSLANYCTAKTLKSSFRGLRKINGLTEVISLEEQSTVMVYTFENTSGLFSKTSYWMKVVSFTNNLAYIYFFLGIRIWKKPLVIFPDRKQISNDKKYISAFFKRKTLSDVIQNL